MKCIKFVFVLCALEMLIPVPMAILPGDIVDRGRDVVNAYEEYDYAQRFLLGMARLPKGVIKGKRGISVNMATPYAMDKLMMVLDPEKTLNERNRELQTPFECLRESLKSMICV